MNDRRMTLWEAIATMEKQMPVSTASVDTIMGVRLAETKRTDGYVLLTAKGPILADGLSVSGISLLLHPTLNFDETSAFAFELEGACVSLDDVRRRFYKLDLTQVPRGRSPEETAVWTTRRPWGVLSFAFKEARPDCLFRVSFRKRLA